MQSQLASCTIMFQNACHFDSVFPWCTAKIVGPHWVRSRSLGPFLIKNIFAVGDLIDVTLVCEDGFASPSGQVSLSDEGNIREATHLNRSPHSKAMKNALFVFEMSYKCAIAGTVCKIYPMTEYFLLPLWRKRGKGGSESISPLAMFLGPHY